MRTVPNTSRLALGRASNLPSINTFGVLSEFLRSAIAGEDSRAFSDSMGALAAHAETVIAGLRASRRREHAAPLLMDMLTVLRDHHALVANLGLAWHGLYECAAYLQSLNNFRVLIGQWLLAGRAGDEEVPVTAEDFELVAWRTLGDGMLLIDMYEQWVEREETEAGSPQEPQPERARQWWQRLRR